ncbi:hypothetical protein EC991_005326 [Linnemannia zychae]|nr:hypothetical protein EC991_005326 [Linnemannia zychae]
MSSASQQQPNSFQVIYRHLHEKHYLDRLIHAFYHRPTRSQQLSSSPVDLGRIAFRNGTWNGESPRHLSSEEADYALTKLQDLFKELYLQPVEQASLRRLLTIIHDWLSEANDIIEEEDEEGIGEDQDQEQATRISGESRLNIPHIIKEIFPCWNSILQEIRNIKISAIGDHNFQTEVATLFRFLFLSLKERNLAFADDWADEARQVLGPIQDSLSSGKYRGPAQRLMREVVCMTDQLWEGGGATDISLAVEKCLTTLIQKSLQGSVDLSDSGAGVGSNVGWDVMRDFEILIQAASRNIAPIPLPSIVWKRSDSEVIMDAAVLEFPHLMPSNIHLNTTTAYDRQTNKSCRLWHLKISGLEVEAKKVAYCYTSKSLLGGKMTDEGELSIVVPPNSLDIELTFVLTPPVVRRGTVTALRSSLDTIGRRHPIVSAARENLFSTSLESQSNHRTRRRSVSCNRLGSGPGAMASSPRSVRFLDTATLDSDAGRTAARTRVRFRQQVQETDTEDFWSSTRDVVSRFLYPNRTYASFSQQQHKRKDIVRSESGSGGQRSTNGWMTLGRPRRRLSIDSSTSRLPFTVESLLPATVASVTPRSVSPASLETPTYYDLVVEPVVPDQRKFVELKKYRIDLRRLNVDVLETQHPVLQMMSHVIMVWRLRKAVERTMREMVMELVNTINTGVDQTMEATREPPQQDEIEDVIQWLRQRESVTVPQRSYEPAQKIDSTGIVTDMSISYGPH